MKCPNCNHEKMEPIIYDSGYGILVKSKTCPACHFNVTAPGELKRKLKLLRENMKKDVKIISIGDGLGVRFPQTFIDFFKIKKGKKVKVKAGTNKIEINF